MSCSRKQAPPRALRLKAALLLLLAAMLCACAAVASTHIACQCPPDECACFLSYGCQGEAIPAIAALLREQGYPCEASAQFDGEMERAVRSFQRDNGLNVSGVLDDDTLTLLLWGQSVEALDAMQASLRAADGGNPLYNPDPVYIPVYGGTKRHCNPGCSQMKEPRIVSVRNAEKLGYAPCKRCKPQ